MSERAELYDRMPLMEADRWWVERAVASPDGRVLELGAGAGRLTAAFLDAGCEVTAVERDPDMLERLRARVGDRADVIAADVTDLADGPTAGFVALPSSLLNEVPDLTGRRRVMALAASRCHPDGFVGLQLLGAWWLVGLAGRSTGRLHPAGGGSAIDMTIDTLGLDPWPGRRSARLTYRFGDGVVLHDDLEASVVTPSELLLLLDEADLEMVASYGAIPPAPVMAEDAIWHVVARPRRLGR